VPMAVYLSIGSTRKNDYSKGPQGDVCALQYVIERLHNLPFPLRSGISTLGSKVFGSSVIVVDTK
jgi:hypothetical protein